ncbi:MAG: hypothetical protein QN152_00720 [Armatimonadota bacterium]|nr:hypothetical protein [Armatimonadota bacterium]MDR7426224.1 hypothetical protein [Armatimonadota bacterium]MDR7464540.1 hypothetical protein [Armatimonadota bacterium]MDR7468999.1 hypothetical protein [Armatimonadota bacterium]MDR7474046.1 hypothetical protein [Armatimonadota bacterium]
MAREVYAEEIEQFLERLEGVASARVVANQEGQIERIFLTTESVRDDGGLRRQVSAALMSEYGLPIEGWRLQIAHLRPEPGRVPPARFRLFRIEETLTESATRVLVDLRYDRQGAQKQAVGVAQSSPGAAFRLRTVAQATLEAASRVLEDVGWKAALESVAVVPFAGVSVALVGLTLAAAGGEVEGPLVQVGGEVVRTSETEAVVKATLRALGQLPDEELPRPRDRWSRMEEMRAHYQRLIRLPQAPPSPAAQGQAQAGPPASPPGQETVEDTIASVQEIRPEVQGGAGMATREEPYRAEGGRPEGGRAPRGGMEDDFYRRLIHSGVAVHIRCRDGYEIPEAVVRDFGTYSLLVQARGVEELIFKHAIISIRPRALLPREVPVQA